MRLGILSEVQNCVRHVKHYITMLCNAAAMFLSICHSEISASVDVNLKSNEKSTRNFHVKPAIPIIITGAPTMRSG